MLMLMLLLLLFLLLLLLIACSDALRFDLTVNVGVLWWTGR
jgi:hypothetical protein